MDQIHSSSVSNIEPETSDIETVRKFRESLKNNNY